MSQLLVFERAFKQAYCVAFLWAILLIPKPLFSQSQQDDFKAIHIKFKEQFKPKAANSARFGMANVDKVGEKHKALSIRRIFPDAGKFEDAHKAYGLHLWYEVKFKKDVKSKDVIDDYRELNYFHNVEENRGYTAIRESNGKQTFELPSGTNDPYFPNQWHFSNTGQAGGQPGSDINLLNAWEIETGSSNVIVAVIDGGINLTHADLKDALWRNTDEIPGNQIDDDRNGYVDDVHGYGFGDQSPTIYPDNHATHVAGIIGAVTNNGIGVAGIAGGDGTGNGVRLMSCAGFSNFGIGGFEAAMVYAADNGAVISQNSWGGGSNAIEAAIEYFINRAGYDNSSQNFNKNIQTGPMAGGLVIFAAGNLNTSDPYYGYPASYEKSIAVASTDRYDMKSSFSNYGTWVDISAPGSSILSTYGSDYQNLSGTSMACPQVSGVAALVISNLQRIGLNPSEVWNRLRLSARSISQENPGMNGLTGWGRLDAYGALQEPDNIPPAPILDLHALEIHSSSLVLGWTATGGSGNEGQAAEYEIRYSTSPITELNFKQAIPLLNVSVPPVAGEAVVLEVKNLMQTTTYYFALKSWDTFNNISQLSNIASVTTVSPAVPEVITANLSAELFSGAISTQNILVKNAGGDELLVRLGVPAIAPAPVGLPTGAKGRLFAINTSKNTIEELNTKTGAVIGSIPMPEPSSKVREGLAFDGTHLFYGRSNKIYKINAHTGQVIRSFILNDVSIINGLAWSGRYLYVSKSYYGTNNIYEVDSDDGSIVRTFNGYSELTFSGNRNSLFRVSGSRSLYEVNIETGSIIQNLTIDAYPKGLAYSTADEIIFVSDEASTIKAIRPTDGTTLYTIPYPVTTALAGDEYKLGWLEAKEQPISISPGSTVDIPIKFMATGLSNGEWTGSVKVITANSNITPIPVPVTLSITSAADIETASELNLGIRYLGFDIDTTVIVENRGFTNLVINQIQSDDNRVSCSISAVTLAPGQKTNMLVNVQPDGPGIIETLITFTSNDPDEAVLSIPLSANILEAPALTVNPDSLVATLNSGETATLAITIANTGNSTLHWNANLVGSDSSANTQSANEQNDVQVQLDSTYKTALGEITLKSSSPESLTCISYDPKGELIYARSILGSTFYTYSPVLDQWNNIGSVPASFYGQAVYLSGKIYFGGTQLNTYTIQSNSWTSAPFPVAGSAESITSDDKYVYVAIEKVLYRFDPATDNWLELAPVPGPLYMTGFGGLTYHSGIIYATGTQGITGDGNTLFFKYFIDSNTWIRTNSISGKVGFGAIDASTARYFVLGGNYISILDIREGEWSKLVTPFAGNGLVFVGNQGVSGIYLLGGNRLARYETASAANWFEIAPTKGSVPAGETQTISVNLSAKGLFGGLHRGNIRVFSTHPVMEENIPLELKVKGEPEAFLSKLSADVGNAIVGYEYGAGGLVIRNKGTASLVVDSISISSPDFTVVDPSTTTTLHAFSIPVGETKSVSPRFKPSATGEQTSTFTFHSNASVNGDFQFVLKGTGVHPAQLVVPTDTIKATLLTGAMAKQKFTIKNTGNGSTQYLTAWGTTSWIKIDGSGYANNIGAHQEREFEATISADGFSEGIYDGNIWVEDYLDPTRVNYQIPVRITVISAPNLLLGIDSLDFGDQFVNGQYDSVIQIMNIGVLPLLFSSMDVNNPSFSLSGIDPLILEPGQIAVVTAHFNPTTISSQTGSITFITNDPDDSLHVLILKGNGVNPPQLSLSNAEFKVTAFQNESISRAMNLSNKAGSKLSWRIKNESNPQPSSAGEFTSKANAPMVFGSPAQLVGLTTDPASGLLYAQYLWYQDLYVYNPQTNTWSEVGHTPAAVSLYKNAGAVILNSKMYSTYAEDDSKIYIYDMVLKDWTSKSNGLGFGTATITTDGTLLYLAGGGKFVSYNPRNSEWIDLSIPNFALDGMGGLSYLDGVIYAHAASSNGFAKYTIATGVWENLIPLPDITTQGSTVDPIRNRYYACGKNYLYEYDIAANIWTVLYFQVFEIGNNGGLSFSSRPGFEGVYFTQGDAGMGFAQYEPKNELAWLRTFPLAGEIQPTESQDIGVNFNAFGLVPGVYNGTIQLTSNDPTQTTLDIPVEFNVIDPTPTIDVPSTIIDTVARLIPYITYIKIKNLGKETLSWNFAETLPSWLSASKTTGFISRLDSDSVELTFYPNLFTSGGVFDYELNISSDDPAKPLVTTRLIFTIFNRAPEVTAIPPNQILTSRTPVTISLLENFKDPDDDNLSFLATSSDSTIVSVSVSNAKLFISPIKLGTSTITVHAADIFNLSATTMFEATSEIIASVESSQSKVNFFVSPNPTEEEFMVHYQSKDPGDLGILDVFVLDITGKIMFSSKITEAEGTNEIEVDVRSSSSGIYNCMLLRNGTLIGSARLIKK